MFTEYQENRVKYMSGKKTRTKKNSNLKRSLLSVLTAVVILIIIFIITPTENPVKNKPDETTESENTLLSSELCLPENDGTYIVHNNYYLMYSEEHEQASWVASMLSADKILLPTVDRNKFSFISDPMIPTGSSVTSDYSGSGYDRGHLLSFASNGWNDESGHDSFYMSNMSPQKPNTNRNTYERLEEAERSATAQNGILFVVHGPVLSDPPYEKIGKTNRISVPKKYFTCFLDYSGDNHKAIGFIIPNDDISYSDITQFAMSVNEVEKITGLNFYHLLPDNEEELLESRYDLSEWDLSKFERKKLAGKYGYDLDNPKVDIKTTEPVKQESQDPVTEFLYFLYVNFGPVKKNILLTLGL